MVKADIQLFSHLKSCQNGNTFIAIPVLNFVIFFLECEKSNAKFLHIRFNTRKY